jgi:hypothetical protein
MAPGSSQQQQSSRPEEASCLQFVEFSVNVIVGGVTKSTKFHYAVK